MLHFNVLREQMAGFTSDEPAPGTDDRYRMCVPYPVNLTLSAADAAADFTLHVAGIADYAYFSPGAPCPESFVSRSLRRPFPHNIQACASATSQLTYTTCFTASKVVAASLEGSFLRGQTAAYRAHAGLGSAGKMHKHA